MTAPRHRGASAGGLAESPGPLARDSMPRVSFGSPSKSKPFLLFRTGLRAAKCESHDHHHDEELIAYARRTSRGRMNGVLLRDLTMVSPVTVLAACMFLHLRRTLHWDERKGSEGRSALASGPRTVAWKETKGKDHMRTRPDLRIKSVQTELPLQGRGYSKNMGRLQGCYGHVKTYRSL